MFSEAAFLRLAGGDATDFGVRARQVPQKWFARGAARARTSLPLLKGTTMNKFLVQSLTVTVVAASLWCARAQDTNLPAAPVTTPPAAPAPAATDLSTPTNLPPAVAPDASAAAPAKAKPSKPKAAKPPGTAFRGQLEATDKVTMTLTVSSKGKSRTLAVTSKTRFTKDGKPAILSDATIGDEVAGYYKKAKHGQLEVISVRFGAKPAASEKPAKAKKPKAAPPAAETEPAPKTP